MCYCYTKCNGCPYKDRCEAEFVGDRDSGNWVIEIPVIGVIIVVLLTILFICLK